MKILFALWSGDLGHGGGSAVAAKNLIESLLKNKDIEVYVVYRVGTEGTLVNWLAENMISFKSISGVGFYVWPKCKGLKGFIKYPFTIIRNFIYYVMSVHEMKRIIGQINPDIVHVNNSVLYYGIKAADDLKVPVLWHIREYADFDFDLIPTNERFKKLIQKHFTVSITPDISKHYGCINSERHFTIYDGVMSKNDVVYNEQKEDYFLYVGAITHNKGVTDLINAFVLYATNNSKGELWIAGRYSDEKYYNNIQEIIALNNLHKRIKFLGFRSDRFQLMQSARACIVPSLFEGFGFITVEAIMNGSLVLGRNTSGTKILMEETGNANFLFDNNEDLALKMEQIINSNPNDYINHIKKSQILAVEKFSTERYGEEMYRIYAKILNKE